MRKIVLLLCLLAIGTAVSYAQEISWDKKVRAFRLIDSLLNVYEDYNKFKTSGTDSITTEAISNFRSLFSDNADIYNEFVPNLFRNPYIIQQQNVYDVAYDLELVDIDKYITEMKQFYKRGIDIIKIRNIAVNLNDFKEDVVYITIEKEFRAKSTIGPPVVILTENSPITYNRDTITLTFSFNENYTEALITKVVNAGKISKVKFSNDSDGDLVFGNEDKCPGSRGVISNRGCPPAFGERIVFNINAGGTLTFVNFNQEKFQNNLTEGYKNTFSPNDNPAQFALKEDFNVFKKSTLGQWHAAAELEYYFGRKKRVIGLGLGAIYTNAKQTVGIDNFFVSFIDKNIDAENKQTIESVRKVISADNIEEQINYTILTAPILFLKYKYNISRKNNDAVTSFLKISAGVGPSFTQAKWQFTKDAPAFNYFSYAKYDAGIGKFVATDINDDLSAPNVIKFDNSKNNALEDLLLYGSSLTPQIPADKTLGIEGLTLTYVGKLQFAKLITGKLYYNAGLVVIYTQLNNSKSSVYYSTYWKEDKIDFSNNNRKLDSYQSLTNGIGRNNILSWGINVGLTYALYNR